MNQLTAKGVVTMSSREIARLVQSKHGDVKRSAERLASAGILTAPLAHTLQHPQNGQTYEEYWFNKRDSLVIVARLSPEFTAAVVDRWQELENSQAVSATNIAGGITSRRGSGRAERTTQPAVSRCRAES
jgi:phage regulator Rha-like protein